MVVLFYFGNTNVSAALKPQSDKVFSGPAKGILGPIDSDATWLPNFVMLDTIGLRYAVVAFRSQSNVISEFNVALAPLFQLLLKKGCRKACTGIKTYACRSTIKTKAALPLTKRCCMRMRDISLMHLRKIYSAGNFLRRSRTCHEIKNAPWERFFNQKLERAIAL